MLPQDGAHEKDRRSSYGLTRGHAREAPGSASGTTSRWGASASLKGPLKDVPEMPHLRTGSHGRSEQELVATRAVAVAEAVSREPPTGPHPLPTPPRQPVQPTLRSRQPTPARGITSRPLRRRVRHSRASPLSTAAHRPT